MNTHSFKKQQYWLIALVTTFITLTLTWQHFNGGVASHYLLHNPNYPAISNYWGLVILPALAWFTSIRVSKRLACCSEDSEHTAATTAKTIKVGFILMLVVTALQSIAWAMGLPEVTKYVALAILISGLFIPIYRAEYFLAHVMASSIVFGSVIPLIGFSVMASISALSHLCVKPLLANLMDRVKATRTA